jgi:hypothetical protein
VSVLALTLAAVVLPVRADDKADDPKAVATKVTSAGAAMFDARDAKGLSQTYTDDARLEVYSKESGDGSSLKIETRVGQAEVKAYYDELFKMDGAVHARNTVEAARYIGDDLLEFAGIFEPNTEAVEPLKLPFHQLRKRSGDSWKIVSLQLFIVPKK